MTVKIVRRFVVVASALAACALILRPQLSTSLVLRGDEFASRGDRRRALAMYERALVLDADNAAAVDRIAVNAILSKRRNELASAEGATTRYLARHRNDALVLSDRALVFHVERRYERAERDFSRAGDLARDARALTFAALDARRLGFRARAKALLVRAVRYDARFLPARQALERES